MKATIAQAVILATLFWHRHPVAYAATCPPPPAATAEINFVYNPPRMVYSSEHGHVDEKSGSALDIATEPLVSLWNEPLPGTKLHCVGLKKILFVVKTTPIVAVDPAFASGSCDYNFVVSRSRSRSYELSKALSAAAPQFQAGLLTALRSLETPVPLGEPEKAAYMATAANLVAQAQKQAEAQIFAVGKARLDALKAVDRTQNPCH
ncbi:MAG TPA: hypothetical protein VEF76_01275 [Patescibacteria group bacterium]|nr:hypothetical protein [Patescibacteria group bacterium]